MAIFEIINPKTFIRYFEASHRYQFEAYNFNVGVSIGDGLNVQIAEELDDNFMVSSAHTQNLPRDGHLSFS